MFSYDENVRMDNWKYKYRIQNEEIRLKIRLTPIDEEMSESHLRRFGHVQKRAINALVGKSGIHVEITKKLKKT